jgi:hypothetical protein
MWSTFTAAELDSITASLLEFHVRGEARVQILQDRPLYNDMMSAKKAFPGGKQYITDPVTGVFTSSLMGYTGDQQVVFQNPANLKRTQVAWYEMSGGISFTQTELKGYGISVVDTNGVRTSDHSDQELMVLTNGIEAKYTDLTEGTARSLAEIMWRDGTQDPLVPPGIRSIILDSPNTGVTCGIDRSVNAWWRNRASLGIDSSTPGNQNIINTLQTEIRQLRRYVQNPKHKIYAGSVMIAKIEAELRSKGNYTLEGWTKGGGATDGGMADITFKGMPIQYEPLLDDLDLANYLFILDLNAIRWRPMQDEEWKVHTPARPPERYVVYRALTYTAAMTAVQLNSSGVYSCLE